jgi:hypothetical protein
VFPKFPGSGSERKAELQHPRTLFAATTSSDVVCSYNILGRCLHQLLVFETTHPPGKKHWHTALSSSGKIKSTRPRGEKMLLVAFLLK